MFNQINVNLSNDPGVNNNLAAVVISTLEEYKKIYFAPPPAGIRPIHIIYDPVNGPMTDSTKDTDKYYVLLTVNGPYYAQVAYQLAHEMCHIFVDPRRSNWFIESCCELASLIILDKLSVVWDIAPPFDYMKSYAPAFKQYSQEYIKTTTINIFNSECFPDSDRLKIWLTETSNTLKAMPLDRPRNAIIALMLRPIFEESNNGWDALRFLGQASTNPPTSLKDLNVNVEIKFDIWERVVPEYLRNVVRRIGAIFGK